MFKRLVFSIVATLLLVAGTLALAPSGVKADPSVSAGTLAATSAVSIDALLLKVKVKCGQWNNWCGSGGYSGGGGGCIYFGGLQLCSGGTGENCHWYNGVKYCGMGGGGGDGSGGGDCYWRNGVKYCNYFDTGYCRKHNGEQYCTGS
jgi:hypothetical protein